MSKLIDLGAVATETKQLACVSNPKDGSCPSDETKAAFQGPQIY